MDHTPPNPSPQPPSSPAELNATTKSVRRTSSEGTETPDELKQLESQRAPEHVPDSYLEAVVALFGHTKRDNDELTFTKGDIIYVTGKPEKEWHEGVCNGTKGLFPVNYTKKERASLGRLKHAHHTITAFQAQISQMDHTPPNPSPQPPSSPAELNVVALHDYTKEDNDELTFTEGDIIYIIDTEKPDYIGWHKGVCNGKIGLFKEIYVKMLEEPSDASHTTPSHNYIEKVVAVFPYSKSTENEISFTKGDIIYVLKNSKDDEWNLGTCNGVTGSFPRNYVKVVEDEQQMKEQNRKEQHRKAYLKAVKEMLTVTIRAVRLNYIGLPRSGKTSFRRRLMNEIKNILEAYLKEQKEQPSTGIAESVGQVIIKTLSHEMGAISCKEWSTLKNLAEEGNMLIQLIYRAMKPVVTVSSKIEPLPSQLPPKQISASANKPVPITSLPKHDPSETVNELESDKSDASETVNEFGGDSISEDILSLIGLAIENDDTDILKLLDDVILLINTDTGGQAEFLDLHSSLVDGPSLNLFFHRLEDDLNKVFKTYYTDESGKSTEKVDSTLTVEEVLFQALSSIACFGGCFLDDKKLEVQEASIQTKSSSNSKSKVLFVGTHRDKVTEDQFQDKDKLLKTKIQSTEFFDKDIIEYALPGQLMLAVNNLTGDENEMRPIRRKLEAVIEENFEKIEIPATWFVLSLYIRSKKWRTLSLAECEKLAGHLNISRDELQHVLWFFHHCIGVHLYYPEVLKDTLICDIQVVFDSATNLIKNTFTDKVSERVYEDFTEKAQFSLKDLKKATSDYTDNDLIPLDKLVKLLEHLGMLTIIPNDDCSQEPTYFMPCVLKSARANELQVSHGDFDPPSLVMRFDCGYVPMGLFPAMITNLVSQQWEDWRLIQEGLRKNKVQFHVGEDFNTVSLLSHPCFFEISVSPREPSKSVESLCARVRGVVKYILDNVTKRIHQNFSMGYKFGFKCPNHPDEDHLCVLEKEVASVMLCLRNPKHKQPITLEPHHKVWFSKPCGITPSAKNTKAYTGEYPLQAPPPTLRTHSDDRPVRYPVTTPTRSSSRSVPAPPARAVTLPSQSHQQLGIDDLPDVLDAVEALSGKWKRFSTKLGIKTSSLDVIERNHPGDAEACLYDALVDWLKMNYDCDKYGKPSWERLARTVKSLDCGLFQEIAKKYPECL